MQEPRLIRVGGLEHEEEVLLELVRGELALVLHDLVREVPHHDLVALGRKLLPRDLSVHVRIGLRQEQIDFPLGKTKAGEFEARLELLPV